MLRGYVTRGSLFSRFGNIHLDLWFSEGSAWLKPRSGRLIASDGGSGT